MDIGMVILKISVKVVSAEGCKVRLNVWLGCKALLSNSRIQLTRHGNLTNNWFRIM